MACSFSEQSPLRVIWVLSSLGKDPVMEMVAVLVWVIETVAAVFTAVFGVSCCACCGGCGGCPCGCACCA